MGLQEFHTRKVSCCVGVQIHRHIDAFVHMLARPHDSPEKPCSTIKCILTGSYTQTLQFVEDTSSMPRYRGFYLSHGKQPIPYIEHTSTKAVESEKIRQIMYSTFPLGSSVYIHLKASCLFATVSSVFSRGRWIIGGRGSGVPI